MMTTTRRLLALLAVFAMLFAACGDDDNDTATSKTSPAESGKSSTTTAAATVPSTAGPVLVARLSGAEEVPGPGVADGVGAVEITFTADQICSNFTVTMGETPVMAHIHQGAKEESGPVVVDLKPMFTPGEAAFISKGCTSADMAKVQPVKDNPAGYYVNVHTAKHPNGAVRGQLAPKQ
jgi:hypothetical protein